MVPLSERAQQALDAGFTNGQLAKAAGVSTGAVSQWLTTTKTLKATSATGLAALTGWNVRWWAEGIGPRSQEPPTRQAHPLSLGDLRLSSPVIEWGALAMIELPKAFKVAAPDDSMSPRLKQGQLAEFETGREYRPGDGVLVRDAAGDCHIRRCRKAHGGWEAYAEDEKVHLPLPIGPGHAEVLAVLVGVHARWG
jgi:hypothetical protein